MGSGREEAIEVLRLDSSITLASPTSCCIRESSLLTSMLETSKFNACASAVGIETAEIELSVKGGLGLGVLEE